MEKIRGKIKNLSFRKSIIFYVSLSLVISFFAANGLIFSANRLQRNIWMKYIGEEYEKAWEDIVKTESPLSIDVYRVSGYAMTPWDNNVSEVCDFLQTWSVLIFSMTGCVAAVFLFYRNKIKEPLKELSDGAGRISKDDLAFAITYQNRDEMGRLCQEFERMRKQLVQNNKKMWEIVEQEKALRSAVAHDIRSPLAVLRGYQEMMIEFLPEEKIDKEQMMEMLQSGMEQIERLDHFLDTMKKLSKIEDRTVEKKKTGMTEIKNRFEKTAQMMSRQYSIVCEIVCNSDTEITVDESMISEVYENLLSNALRYAKKTVQIFLGANPEKKRMEIRIVDDGTGFTEEFEKVTKAYYHANPQDDFKHFGLGLYLCRIYCEKHGGKLLIGNAIWGGAEVKAIFQTE